MRSTKEACFTIDLLVDGSTVMQKPAQMADEQWLDTGPHHANMAALATVMPCWQHCVRWKVRGSK